MFKIGIKCENHTASIILLKQLFGLDNRKIQQAKKERVDKQYYVGFRVARSDVTDLITVAGEFNSALLDFMDKLGSQNVTEIRGRFRQLVS